MPGIIHRYALPTRRWKVGLGHSRDELTDMMYNTLKINGMTDGALCDSWSPAAKAHAKSGPALYPRWRYYRLRSGI